MNREINKCFNGDKKEEFIMTKLEKILSGALVTVTGVCAATILRSVEYYKALGMVSNQLAKEAQEAKDREK